MACIHPSREYISLHLWNGGNFIITWLGRKKTILQSTKLNSDHSASSTPNGGSGHDMSLCCFHLTLKVKVRKCESLSHVQFFATPWSTAHQKPLSKEFSLYSSTTYACLELLVTKDNQRAEWPHKHEGVPPKVHCVLKMLLLVIMRLRSSRWWSCQISCCCSVKLCPTICNSMDCSMPHLPVPHHLQEFVQVHVHWIGDAIQPSHPLPSSSPSVFNLS